MDGDQSADIALEDGDEIVIPKEPNSVYVSGFVNYSGYVPYQQDAPLELLYRARWRLCGRSCKVQYVRDQKSIESLDGTRAIRNINLVMRSMYKKSQSIPKNIS